jgi:hypothetical protein
MSLCTERSLFPGMTLYTERSLDESVYREESVNGKVSVGTECLERKSKTEISLLAEPAVKEWSHWTEMSLCSQWSLCT